MAIEWVDSGGRFSGYNPDAGGVDTERYTFAGEGMVDVNAITRLGLKVRGRAGLPEWVDYAHFRGHLHMTAADIDTWAANFAVITMVAYIKPKSAFPVGHVPTWPEMLDAPIRFRAQQYAQAADGTGTRHFTFPRLDIGLNETYWVMLQPAVVHIIRWNQNYPVTYDNFPLPTGGIQPRGISVSGNRRPNAPTLTTTPPAPVVTGGSSTVMLTMSANADPDWNPGALWDSADRDYGGVELQYSPIPSASNPNPTWSPLPSSHFGMSTQSGVFRSGASGAGNSVAFSQLIEHSTSTIAIRCGYPNVPNSLSGAVLPSGRWRIRARVSDYGHPFPNVGSLGPGLLGNAPISVPTPSTLQSPWSEPVVIHVDAQVPPPVPLSPIDDAAQLVNEPLYLSWKYRNTAIPSVAQESVRIDFGLAGAATERFSFTTSNPNATIPTFIGDTNYVEHESFKLGGANDWYVIGAAGYENEYELTSTPYAAEKGATRDGVALQVDFVGPGVPSGFAPTIRHHTPYELGADDDFFQFAVRLAFEPGSASATGARVGMQFYNGTTPVGPAVERMFDAVLDDDVYRLWHSQGSWLTAYTPVTERPSGATHVMLYIKPTKNGLLTSTDFESLRFDRVRLLAARNAPTSSAAFPLESNTRYQWSVAATDAVSGESDMSNFATFWGADASVSGNDAIPGPYEGVLGCGHHRVYVYKSGGLVRLGEVTGCTEIKYDRLRDEISAARIVVKDWSDDCGALLASLDPWAHEIVIFRDNGTEVDRVWEGPIITLTYKSDEVVIAARDVGIHLYRRAIKQEMNDGRLGGRTVVDRALRIIRNVMAPHDPNVLKYLLSFEGDRDPTQWRNTPAYSRTAYEEIDDMAANSGLDYTIVGRRIIVWGTKSRIGLLPEFQDGDLGATPIVSLYGMSYANSYTVSDGNGLYGSAYRWADYLFYKGPVEMLSSSWASDSMPTEGTYSDAEREKIRQSFRESAEHSLVSRNPVPVVVRIPDNTTISPQAVLSINHLVPGVSVPLRSNGLLRSFSTLQKLDSVTVTEKEGEERITITLSPFYREDSDAEEVGGE